MNVKLFNNDTIVAPLKCGTRQLEELFGTPMSLSTDMLKRNLTLNNIETMIVRPPIEHMKSAIHTELLSLMRNDHLRTDSLELRDFVENFFQWGSSHWEPDMYEYLYKFWNRNDYINIVQLKDLSEFIYGLTGQTIIHKPNDWNFSNTKRNDYWISSNALWDWVEQEFEHNVNYLIETKMNKEMDWYNKLINKEKTIFKPKLI